MVWEGKGGGVVVGVDGSGRTHRLAAIAADAAGDAVWIRPPVDDVHDLEMRLERARSAGSIVLVDDAHRLPADVLRTLAAAARRGVDMVVARRPTIHQPELAELDEVAAGRGGVERLQPLDEAATGELLARTSDLPPPPADRVSALHAASAGMPAIAAELATTSPGKAAAGLVARVQRRLATMEPAARRLAVVLALDVELRDDAVALACDVSAERLPHLVRMLQDSGMLIPDRDAMIPAVAEAVLTELSPAERRRVHNDVAHAMLSGGADPLAAANQLQAARAVGPAAADVYRMAGERLRFTDPDAALRWFAEAAVAGADPRALVAARAEAAALLGHPIDAYSGDVPAADARRLALVTGAVEAHEGRPERAAEALLAAGDIGRVLAGPALVAVGRFGDAKPALAAEADVPRALLRFAEAALASLHPVEAVPLFIEAAEAAQNAPPAAVLPDTPHALGALVAVAAGDAATAVRLLDQAVESGVGGPVAVDRHRLLRAWVRMRVGRFDAALTELPRVAHRVLSGRDRLLRAAIVAGLARRSGDIARMRETWAQAEHELARGVVDLFHVEVFEEFVVTSARLGEYRRASPIVDKMHDVVDRLGRPPIWQTAVGWMRLQAAVVGDDGDQARAAVADLDELRESSSRAQAQRLAAGCWADVLAGRVQPADVVAASDALVEAELPWEASRLAGQAAIRTTDPTLARRLLERARDLTHPDAAAGGRTGGASAVLSEREVEVGRLVLAGQTHKEIGAQLYLSPKTVEHHVARMRTKLGATTRADLLAALRELLETRTARDPSHGPPNAVS